ncbi:MAG: c-type cytochrome [Hyphomonadaceae bacterium]
MPAHVSNGTGVGALALMLAVIAAPAAAQTAGDPVHGKEVADASCARCHAVEAGETISAATRAPTFQTIADTPGMTPMALNVWLHSTHNEMPQLRLPAEDVDDLTAYIRGLKSKGE